MKRFLLAVPLALAVGGCRPVAGQGTVAINPTPSLLNSKVKNSTPGGTEIEPGVWREEVRLRERGDAPRLWIYRPASALAPNSKAKFPCVFIAPAGTTVTSGAPLNEGERDTHTPYVRAGMIVVAYEIDGLAGDKAQAAQEFMRGRMGLRNSQRAISYALRHVRGVDPTRLYAVGHSSAGTIALQTAEQDRRIAACVAFAPACNFSFPEAGGGVFENAVEQDPKVPGFSAFLATLMPQTNVAKLKCPLFLFSADDDRVVSPAEVQGFARAAQSAGVRLTFMRVPSGGHVGAMRDVGISSAIQWLQALPATKSKKRLPVAANELGGLHRPLVRSRAKVG